MSRMYTAAVIGAGMGGQLSIKALTSSPRYQLVAVADLRADARQAVEASYPNVRTFATHQELFETCPVDVVCVSTWPTSHRQVTEDALKLPLTGILVEKPLADRAQDGQAVLDMVRDRQLPIAVPHGLLVAPHALEVVHRVQAGEIGDLKLIEIQCSGWDIINAGIHWLNFVVVLTRQEPADVVLAAIDASTRTYRDGMQVETLAVTTIQLRSGAHVVMTTGDYVTTSEPGKVTLFRLIGAHGRIDFYGWESRYRVVNAAFPSGHTFEIDPGPIAKHQIHLDNMADQMDRGAPDYAIATSSLRTLELCEAAYVSAAQHCAVTLPLATFAPPTPTDWAPGQPYAGQGGGRDGRKLPPLTMR